MDRRVIATASLVAALSLGSLAVGASAQEPAEKADLAATSKSVTGLVTEGTNADGQTTYYLTPEGGEPIELSYGPAWLWGLASPLQQLVGTEVTVVGQLRDGVPNDNASEMAQAQADASPVLHVRSIVGLELRENGKPPWAGGPKVVGEAHPGYEGWSEGQAEKAADKAARAAEKAADAEAKAAEKAANAAVRAEEKAARAEQRAAERAGRAEAKGNRP